MATRDEIIQSLANMDASREMQKPVLHFNTGRPASPVDLMDAFSGAPFRAGVDAYLKGKFGDALPAAWKQVGQDPELAPTWEAISKRIGLDQVDVGNPSFASAKLGEPVNPAPNVKDFSGVGEVVGNLIEPSLPMGGLLKGEVKAVKGMPNVLDATEEFLAKKALKKNRMYEDAGKVIGEGEPLEHVALRSNIEKSIENSSKTGERVPFSFGQAVHEAEKAGLKVDKNELLNRYVKSIEQSIDNGEKPYLESKLGFFWLNEKDDKLKEKVRSELIRLNKRIESTGNKALRQARSAQKKVRAKYQELDSLNRPPNKQEIEEYKQLVKEFYNTPEAGRKRIQKQYFPGYPEGDDIQGLDNSKTFSWGELKEAIPTYKESNLPKGHKGEYIGPKKIKEMIEQLQPESERLHDLWMNSNYDDDAIYAKYHEVNRKLKNLEQFLENRRKLKE